WLDEARDAICVTDLAGRLTYLNHSAALLHGHAMDQALGRPLADLFGLFSQALLPVALEQVHATGTWTGELQMIAPDGNLRQLESRWTLIRDPAGRAHSVLLLNTDVTERRQLETQLRRAQRIESIGMLAGGLAHDLNNMLSPILMGLGLLRLKSSDPEALRLADIMAGSAEKGAALIRQVLAFARGAEGEKRPLEVRPVIREVAAFLSETLPRSIVIQEEVPADLWLIRGDATQLHQVLMNLGVNARDAMPAGGLLVFQAENTAVDAMLASAHPGAQPGDYVVITVEDTGTGIPSEVVDRIFDPFFTTKALGKGTGLGLSMVLGIVKAHGGFLTVHSEPGNGTAFRLLFPAERATLAPEEPAVIPAAPHGHGETILVIDDEASIRDMLRTFLEHYGYRVRLAEDGASGIELHRLHRDEIQLILTDMMMPGLQIGALLSALREVTPEIPIVLMSGLIGPENRETIATLACAGFMQKPMTGEDLAQVIRRALSGASRDG
ncbi:MAG: response regulator, partial [Opitutae bacterium]|nr:response regulator [Opitutae bacterium]